ncbi:MAG: ADP-ribosylglycohydrolase family protein [Acidimicrobiia bacterium]
MMESLAGLSVGDAFGQRFFFAEIAANCLPDRILPPAPWRWTDDTNMALSIVEVLLDGRGLDQDALAQSFAARYNSTRGYGPAMHGLLRRIQAGANWRAEARRLFSGQGSYGNGASMRVAPLGAFWARDLDRVADEASRSAEVTHAHPEGIAGAIAVAVGAAAASKSRGEPLSPSDFLEVILESIPAGAVRAGIELAAQLEPEIGLVDAVARLGNGSRITAQDTVPFALWVAAHHLDDYEDALWSTAEAGGDVDTTCAIVGGVVAGRVGVTGIPPEWLERREALPNWAAVAEGSGHTF